MTRKKLTVLKKSMSALMIAITIFGIFGTGSWIKDARADLGGGSSDSSILLNYYDDAKWITLIDHVTYCYDDSVNKTICTYTPPSGYEIIFVDASEISFTPYHTTNATGVFKVTFKGQLDDGKWADITYAYAADNSSDASVITSHRPAPPLSIPSGFKNFKADVYATVSGYSWYTTISANVTCRVLIAKPKAAANLGDLNTTLTSINSQLANLINVISAGNANINSRQAEIRNQIQTLANNVNSLVTTYNSKMNSEIVELQGIKGELTKMAGDKIPPELSLSWENGATITSAASKNLRVWATDNVGVTQMKINGGAWKPYTDNVSIPLAAGVNEITVFVRDAAGNAAKGKITIMKR